MAHILNHIIIITFITKQLKPDGKTYVLYNDGINIFILPQLL